MEWLFSQFYRSLTSWSYLGVQVKIKLVDSESVAGIYKNKNRVEIYYKTQNHIYTQFTSSVPFKSVLCAPR